MGIGFLVDNIPAGMFIGLGAGFVLLAIVNIFKKSSKIYYFWQIDYYGSIRRDKI